MSDQAPDAPQPADDEVLDVTLSDEDLLPPAAPTPAPAGNLLVIDSDQLTAPLPAAARPQPAAPDAFPTAEAVPEGVPPKGKKAAAPVTAADVLTVLNMILAGAIGGFLGWVFANPYIHDQPPGATPQVLPLAVVLGGMGLFFGCVGGMIGMMLAAVEGVQTRSWEKASRAAAIGLGVGAAGGFLGGVIGQILYGALGGSNSSGPLTGQQVFARSVGWALVGVVVGLAQGVVTRSQRRMWNGAIGGLLGGLAGGLLFDPLPQILAKILTYVSPTEVTIGGTLSRLVGLVVLGMACGAAIGVIQQVAKEAWLRVVEGPLKGKQFILYRSPTVLGSSPQCDIPLLRDKSVAPQHAAISEQGGRYVLSDLNSPMGTRVNGQPIRTRTLHNGDRLTLGQTTLVYADRTIEGQ
jgi:hypothetical protein